MADVRRVIDAARRVRGHEALLAKEWAKSTGLSVEGVHLALHEHLEVDDVTEDDLRSLIAAAGDTSIVHVVLSANVFVAALRAVALARAAAPRVVVRPSSRDPIFVRALVHELGDPAVTVVDTIDFKSVREGEVHVYGRDETIAKIRMRVEASLRVRGHGTGMGLAMLSPDDDVHAAAIAVARDVVPFDQRGCLSPRVVMVMGEGAKARALAFAERLAGELGEWEKKVPRGELHDDERADAARYRGTMAFAGELFDAVTYAVAVGDEVTLPPPGRHVHVVPCTSDDALTDALSPLARHVAALGENVPSPLLQALVPRARRSPLGFMQRPRLDGPVDLR